jgi:hypothetical protein
MAEKLAACLLPPPTSAPERLSAEERPAFIQLWADVTKLLKKAEEKPNWVRSAVEPRGQPKLIGRKGV